MKKFRIVPAALLVLACAVPAAAEETKKPSTSVNTGAAQQAGKPSNQSPFKVWVDGNWIFVVNNGNSDWTGGVLVGAACQPVAPSTACGSGPEWNGLNFTHKYDKFPKGHGNAPIKGSGNAQQIEGPGWIAVFLGLPVGSYKVTASAAYNLSPQTDVTIAAPSTGKVIRVSPGTIQLAPTKTP
ncbi:MAG TPA: hypothetical protein VF425_09425 [Thermoanaerobaculia bacterium]